MRPTTSQTARASGSPGSPSSPESDDESVSASGRSVIRAASSREELAPDPRRRRRRTPRAGPRRPRRAPRRRLTGGERRGVAAERPPPARDVRSARPRRRASTSGTPAASSAVSQSATIDAARCTVSASVTALAVGQIASQPVRSSEPAARSAHRKTSSPLPRGSHGSTAATSSSSSTRASATSAAPARSATPSMRESLSCPSRWPVRPGARSTRSRASSSPRSGGDYDRVAAVLSFGQDPRWRRALVARNARSRASAHVLDVATGTAAVAIALARRYGCRVTGLDQSRRDARDRAPSASHARVSAGGSSSSRVARRTLPFDGRDLRRRHRDLRPALRRRRAGGRPRARARRAARLAGRLPRLRRAARCRRRASPGRRTRARACRSPDARSGTAGSRSAASSTARSARSATRYPPDAAGGGLRGRRPRRRTGSPDEPRRWHRDHEPARAALMDADRPLERPAFYALAPGGWRDYVTLLHPPYTAWHLSYVAIGAALSGSRGRRPARRDAGRLRTRSRRRRALPR